MSISRLCRLSKNKYYLTQNNIKLLYNIPKNVPTIHAGNEENHNNYRSKLPMMIQPKVPIESLSIIEVTTM
jgi:hypothetical protein